MDYIEKYISEPRKENILAFYDQYSERLMLMPAAHKKEYHNAFPGGYVEHVLRVIRCAIKQATLWGEECWWAKECWWSEESSNWTNSFS